eukprot:5441219-Prymnesium_polylepis.1
MDFDEFHDFVIDCDLPTKAYGFDTMGLQYEEANKGSNDKVLELHEFIAMVTRVAFNRANPQVGGRSTPWLADPAHPAPPSKPTALTNHGYDRSKVHGSDRIRTHGHGSDPLTHGSGPPKPMVPTPSPWV